MFTCLIFRILNLNIKWGQCSILLKQFIYNVLNQCYACAVIILIGSKKYCHVFLVREILDFYVILFTMQYKYHMASTNSTMQYKYHMSCMNSVLFTKIECARVTVRDPMGASGQQICFLMCHFKVILQYGNPLQHLQYSSRNLYPSSKHRILISFCL